MPKFEEILPAATLADDAIELVRVKALQVPTQHAGAVLATLRTLHCSVQSLSHLKRVHSFKAAEKAADLETLATVMPKHWAAAAAENGRVPTGHVRILVSLSSDISAAYESAVVAGIPADQVAWMEVQVPGRAPAEFTDQLWAASAALLWPMVYRQAMPAPPELTPAEVHRVTSVMRVLLACCDQYGASNAAVLMNPAQHRVTALDVDCADAWPWAGAAASPQAASPHAGQKRSARSALDEAPGSAATSTSPHGAPGAASDAPASLYAWADSVCAGQPQLRAHPMHTASLRVLQQMSARERHVRDDAMPLDEDHAALHDTVVVSPFAALSLPRTADVRDLDGSNAPLGIACGRAVLNMGRIAAFAQAVRLQPMDPLPASPPRGAGGAASATPRKQRKGQYLATGWDAILVEEPGPMDAMALLHARVSRIFFARPAPMSGALRSCTQLHLKSALNHQYRVWQVQDVAPVESLPEELL